MNELAQLRVEVREDVPVARIEGEVDLANADDLRLRLAAAVAPVGPGLVVDLSATTYLDSAGLHLLFALAERLAEQRQALRAVVPEHAPLRRTLAVAGLERAVPLHAVVSDALTAMRAEPDELAEFEL